jgi:hypothetical protein
MGHLLESLSDNESGGNIRTLFSKNSPYEKHLLSPPDTKCVDV